MIKNHNIGASNSGYYYVIYDDILAIFQLSTLQRGVVFFMTYRIISHHEDAPLYQRRVFQIPTL